MAITVMDTALNKKVLAAAIIAISSANAYAGDWQFKPKLLIDETYTNNVTLALNDEQPSLVSQAGISFENIFTSNKLDFSFASTSTYAMYSHDHEIDNDFHELTSDFRLKLWPKGLALVGSASISNQARNTSRNALADIVSADTIQVESYTGGFEYTVNNSRFLLNSNIIYQLNESEDNVGDQQGYNTNIFSKNGNGARYIYWDANASYSDLKNGEREGNRFNSEIKVGLITGYMLLPFLRYYDENNDGEIQNNSSTLESNSYGAGFRWLVTPKLFLDLSYNKSAGTQLDLDGNEQEDYTAASIKWQPSQRTQLEMNYGQRFYGESFGLSFSHKNRRLTNEVSYVEDVKLFTRNNYESVLLGSYWCPQGDVTDTTSCFINNDEYLNFDDYQLINLSDFVLREDQDLSLNKALQWTSTLELSRTTLNLSLSGLRRENLSTRKLDEDKRASFSISRKVSGKSSLNLNIEYADTHFALEQENERQDRYRRYSLEYEKSLNSKLTVKFGLSHLNRSSTTQSLNYEEDRVTLNISKGF